MGKASLSRTLLIKVAGFSLLLTAVSVGLNGWATYRFELQRQQEEVNAVLAAYSGGLSKAAWELDQESIRVQLQGLSQFSTVLSAQVDVGDFKEAYVKPGAHQQQVAKEVSYNLRSPDQKSVIAVWRLKLDEQAVTDKVMDNIRTVLPLVALELLLQAMLIFWLVQRTISTPLIDLARHVRQIKSKGLTKPVPLRHRRRDDELDDLSLGIMQLQQDLRQELANREETSSRLALREEQLLRISQSSVIDDGDLVQTYRLITSAVCAALKVQRASVWLWNPQETAIVSAYLFDQLQGPSQTPVQLNQDDYPRYFQALVEDRSIMAHDAMTDPQTSEFAAAYLPAHGITSMLDVPIRHGGQLVGVLCCEHTGPARQWREEEGFFASAVADLISRALTAQARMVAETELKDLLGSLERRVADRTAQLEESNQYLETFAFSVSHDLKAPLRGISGYAQLLNGQYRDQLPAEAQSFVDNILSASQRMHDVIEDLLTYSRVGRRTLAVRTFGLRKVLDTIMGDLTMDIPPGRLQWHLQVEDMPLTADLECFMQIVRNLIDNAIKFSRDEPQPAIEIRAETTPLGLRLMVKDNGCGFDMKYHDRMYGIFQRLQSQEAYPGTGVGLAIVAKAAERLGGRVWAEGRTREASPDGHGATFYLEMPLAAPAQAKMSEP